MPKKQIKNSFNAGELSEYLAGRTDLQKYFNGCSRLVNGTPLTYGGVEKRAGTFYRETAKGKARLFSFQFSVDDTHLLELGASYMRILKTGSYANTLKSGIATWTATTAFAVNDYVVDDGAGGTGFWYYCITAHTSGAGTAIPSGDIANWARLTVDPNASTRVIVELFTPFGDVIDWITGVAYVVDQEYYDPATTKYYKGLTTNVSDNIVDDLASADIEETTPTTSEIFGAHVVQSGDVMYIATNEQHPQKISRFGDTSWTIADADFSGGPFLEENTDDTLTLTFTHDEVAFDSPHYHLVGAQGVLTSTGHTPFLAGHVGSIWELKVFRTDDVSVTQVAVGTSMAIPIKGTFSVDASGFATSTPFSSLTLQRKEGVGDWQAYRTFTSAIAFTSEELNDDVAYRLVLTGAAVNNAVLTAREQVQLGAVHVDSFNSTSSVNVTVVNDVYHSHEGAQAVTGLALGGTGGGSGDINVRIVGHGYVTADRVFFDSITNSDYSYLNNEGTEDTTFQIIRIDDDNFTLDDTDGTNGRTGGSEITSGVGNVQRLSATTTTSQWAEGSWSSIRGFPTTVTFHEDRLWWASTSNNPQTVWGSVTSDYENYLAGVFDDDAVQFALNVNDISEIQWLVSRNALFIGTANSEHTLSAANPDNPITPSDVKVRAQSVYGSSGIQPRILNNAIFYLQRSNRKMRGLIFDFDTISTRSFDTNRLHNTILEAGVSDMAIQKSLEGIVYLVKSDGSIAGFTYEPEEEVAGWSRWITGRSGQAGFIPSDGKFISIAVTSGANKDVVTVIVNRQINGNSVYYIEEFAASQIDTIDDAVLLDSCIQVLSDEVASDFVLASDTVRAHFGLANSGPCGGVLI